MDEKVQKTVSISMENLGWVIKQQIEDESFSEVLNKVLDKARKTDSLKNHTEKEEPAEVPVSDFALPEHLEETGDMPEQEEEDLDD